MAVKRTTSPGFKAPVFNNWTPTGTLKARLELIRVQSESMRSSFISHYQEIADFIRPRRPRFLVTDVNQGDKRSSKIINSAGTLASDVLAAGMMSGITSPSRPWLSLRTPFPELNARADVQEWLYSATAALLTDLGRTNFYEIMQEFYMDLGDFATALIYAEKDMRKVAKFKSVPVGSYTIGRDSDGKINCVTRRFMMQARQIVDTFGETGPDGKIDMTKFSYALQSSMKTGGINWFEVVHICLPNNEYVEGDIGIPGKKWLSVHYELGSGSKQITMTDEVYGKYLRVSGYDDFPFFDGIWARTGEDDYGTSCPGMSTLADIKQLQTMERRGAKALEKMVDPAMQGPTGVTKSQVSMLPGSLSIVDSSGGKQALTPLHEVRVDFNQLREDKKWITDRIDEHYFKRMFLMMIETGERQMTATEVNERSQEKLLVLGPVLERLNNGVFDPLIDWFFKQMMALGRFSPPPPALAGVTLTVEYLSINAAAQKSLGLAGLDRLAQSVEAYAAVDPTIVRSINPQKLASSWAQFGSVPPGVVRSDEEVAQIAQQQEQAAAQQQAAEQAQMHAQTAKNLAGADTGGKNALTDLIKQGNYGQPGGNQ